MFKKLYESVKDFLVEVKTETRKSTFPSKEDTIGTTTVVIMLVLIATVYLWILDISLSSVIAKILP